jgi:hypothetical protein
MSSLASAGAIDNQEKRGAAPAPCGCRTRERIVHHATDRSPFNPPFTILREWRRALRQIPRIAARKYRRPACLSVRLSGV